MTALTGPSLRARFQERGFISGIDILLPEEAAAHRSALESAEQLLGPMHYRSKAHVALRSPLQLATLPVVLDTIESLIGPNILLHNTTYIIKEPHTAQKVSWHQDLTYWGFSHDDQVSMWLALSPATAESGCMRMVPGSHRRGQLAHQTTDDDTNLLLQGQTVADVDEAAAELCPLRPGQASFHHGYTLHASFPNLSAERRIGLNVQYIATHVMQTKHAHDTALLVRGCDDYRHFAPDIPAVTDCDPAGIERFNTLDAHYRKIAGTD